jgi:hypothetical protein
MKPNHDMFGFIYEVKALATHLNDMGEITTENAIITKKIWKVLWLISFCRIFDAIISF